MITRTCLSPAHRRALPEAAPMPRSRFARWRCERPKLSRVHEADADPCTRGVWSEGTAEAVLTTAGSRVLRAPHSHLHSHSMRRYSRLVRVAMILSLAAATSGPASRAPRPDDWPVYGGDPGSMKYSSLSAINRPK